MSCGLEDLEPRNTNPGLGTDWCPDETKLWDAENHSRNCCYDMSHLIPSSLFSTFFFSYYCVKTLAECLNLQTNIFMKL